VSGSAREVAEKDRRLKPLKKRRKDVSAVSTKPRIARYFKERERKAKKSQKGDWR